MVKQKFSQIARIRRSMNKRGPSSAPNKPQPTAKKSDFFFLFKKSCFQSLSERVSGHQNAFIKKKHECAVFGTCMIKCLTVVEDYRVGVTALVI